MRLFSATVRSLVLGISLLALGSCASAQKIRGLREGMAEHEVSSEIGNPETIRRDGTKVVWIYRTGDGRCAVVFESEKVSSWACAGDETSGAAQREVAASAASKPPVIFMH